MLLNEGGGDKWLNEGGGDIQLNEGGCYVRPCGEHSHFISVLLLFLFPFLHMTHS